MYMSYLFNCCSVGAVSKAKIIPAETLNLNKHPGLKACHRLGLHPHAKTCMLSLPEAEIPQALIPKSSSGCCLFCGG